MYLDYSSDLGGTFLNCFVIMENYLIEDEKRKYLRNLLDTLYFDEEILNKGDGEQIMRIMTAITIHQLRCSPKKNLIMNQIKMIFLNRSFLKCLKFQLIEYCKILGANK